MKGASNARVIWQIDVDFDADGNVMSIERRCRWMRAIAFDPDYEVLVGKKWRGRLLEKFPFLEAAYRYGGIAAWTSARRPCPQPARASWGNFVVDQMRDAFGEPASGSRVHQQRHIANRRLHRQTTFAFEDIGRTFGFQLFSPLHDGHGCRIHGNHGGGLSRRRPKPGLFPAGFRLSCLRRSQPPRKLIVS